MIIELLIFLQCEHAMYLEYNTHWLRFNYGVFTSYIYPFCNFMQKCIFIPVV